MASGAYRDDGEGSPPVKHTQMDNEDEGAIEMDTLQAGPEDEVRLLEEEADGYEDKPQRVDKDDADDPASLVAKVVPATDDPTLTTLTVRVFIIGSALGALGAAIAMTAYFKSNSFGLSSFFIILVSYPSAPPSLRERVFGLIDILSQWVMPSLDGCRTSKSRSAVAGRSRSTPAHLGPSTVLAMSAKLTSLTASRSTS